MEYIEERHKMFQDLNMTGVYLKSKDRTGKTVFKPLKSTFQQPQGEKSAVLKQKRLKWYECSTEYASR
jgi:hypothetical protein